MLPRRDSICVYINAIEHRNLFSELLWGRMRQLFNSAEAGRIQLLNQYLMG